ncbi:MAG: carbonic anhydrase [Pseudohongiellaceae bacterium]
MPSNKPIPTADEALQRLRQGNQRFQNGVPTPGNAKSRSTLTNTQQPFAIILGCSDSRVPVELIFDQGPGDLFVVRVAGNIVTPSQMASIEFAIQQFGTQLVVVLGHSSCGAVHTTLQQLLEPDDASSSFMSPVLDCIRPALEPLINDKVRAELKGVKVDDAKNNPNISKHLAAAVQANIKASVETLKYKSLILKPLIKNDGLHILGAEYSLESGLVTFFNK